MCENSAPPKGVQLRDFLIPEKFGIVVMSGYAVFLCFGAGAWQLSNVVSDYLDLLQIRKSVVLGILLQNAFLVD